MLMLERLLCAKVVYVAVLLFSVVAAYTDQLQPVDLSNPQKVVAALGQDLTDEETRTLQAFVAEAHLASNAGRYGPAVKAWGTASLIQPNAENLAMLIEANLREIGLTADPERAKERRATAYPGMLKLYESALAAEHAKPVLGDAKPQIIAHHACLKAYVEEKTLSDKCEPLVWSGMIK